MEANFIDVIRLYRVIYFWAEWQKWTSWLLFHQFQSLTEAKKWVLAVFGHQNLYVYDMGVVFNWIYGISIVFRSVLLVFLLSSTASFVYGFDPFWQES